MSGLRLPLLAFVFVTFIASTAARAETRQDVTPLPPQVKAEIRALQVQIKADREFLNKERERLKPIFSRLEANKLKLRTLQDQIKQERDAEKERKQGSAAPQPPAYDDDPFDDLPTPSQP